MSLKEPEVLSACLIRYMDGSRGSITEEVLMQFPLRPKGQESTNSSENMQTMVPDGELLEHSHVCLSGTEFSYFENLVGRA